MKLLGWMHRKFRQNSGDLLKDFPTGPTCNCLSGRPAPEDHHQISPLSSIPSRICHSMNYEVPPLSSDEEFMLSGLLSIGTLGAMPKEEEEEKNDNDNDNDDDEEEKIVQDSATVESIAEKEETDTATETDLMVVSAELEKVLIADAESHKGGTDRLSSARPSSVGKKIAATDCPLQEYLFGSSTMEVYEEEEKKEKRSSLGELFLKEAEDGEGKRERERKVGEEKEEKTAATMSATSMGVQLAVKKMLKRRGSSKGSRRSSGGDGDATTTAKFHKIMQMFHRKVHPENSMTPRKTAKSSSKNERKDGSYPGDEGNYSIGISGTGSVFMKGSKRAYSNYKDGNAELIKCSSDLSLAGFDSMENREYWIKTDADYLVLEL